MNEPTWLVEAKKYIDLREYKGSRHEPKILQLWRSIGLPGIKDDETPWCAAFVGAMLENVGIVSSRSGWARDYMKWGIEIDRPIIGCVVVFSREGGGGHVGFAVGYDLEGRIMVIGGNQSDSVNVKAFDNYRILGYRWPVSVPMGTYWGNLPIYSGPQEISKTEA